GFAFHWLENAGCPLGGRSFGNFARRDCVLVGSRNCGVAAEQARSRQARCEECGFEEKGMNFRAASVAELVRCLTSPEDDVRTSGAKEFYRRGCELAEQAI